METFYTLPDTDQSSAGREIPDELANLAPAEVFKCAMTGDLVCVEVIRIRLFQTLLNPTTSESKEAAQFFSQAEINGFKLLFGNKGLNIAYHTIES